MNEEIVIYKLLKNKVDPSYETKFLLKLRIKGIYSIYCPNKIGIVDNCKIILENLDKVKLDRFFREDRCWIRLRYVELGSLYTNNDIFIYFKFDFFTRYFNMKNVLMLEKDKNRFHRLIKLKKLI